MGTLPTEVKLTNHALQRLSERQQNSTIIYNTKNLIKSECKWYNRDDLIFDSALYIHSLYVCRKSNQLGYITNGEIEVVYNKNTKVAITVLEVKEKFKPISQYIKSETLAKIEAKKELKKMNKTKSTGICPDCGKEGAITSQGICVKCRTRKTNAKYRRIEYIPYINLSDKQKAKIDHLQNKNNNIEISVKEEKLVDNYYQAKAEHQPVVAEVTERKIISNPLNDQNTFINTLKNCGCEIPENTLKEVLNVLLATDKLKDLLMTITKNDCQQALLDLEQALNVGERKLQHNWEFNGFQEEDDIKFKNFLTWRRTLKGAIYFWKKLYQTGTLIEMQRAWNSYTADPNDKTLLAGDEIKSSMKRWQITTESISTILNTRRPFTRIFYATTKEDAYNMFTKWMADRQLHEDKSKTVITELTSEGADGRKG